MAEVHGNRTHPESSGKTANLQSGGAESGALGAHSTPIDADLQAIIEAWPKLNESTKAGILASVRANRDGCPGGLFDLCTHPHRTAVQERVFLRDPEVFNYRALI